MHLISGPRSSSNIWQIWQNLTMKNRVSAFDYPILIRQNLGFITVSVPDLNIIMVEDRPLKGRLEKHFLLKLAKTIGLCWLKIDEQIKLEKTKIAKPSKTKKILSPMYKNQPLKINEASKILGVSENTLRRMVRRRQIACVKTARGHRRFTEASLKKWIDKTKNDI